MYGWRMGAYCVILLVGLVGGLSTLLYLGRRGSLFTAAVPFIVSHVCIFTLRMTLEYGEPSVDPRDLSWAMFIGDAVALTLAFGAAAWCWRSLRHVDDAWYLQRWWLIACIIAGIAIALTNRVFIDGSNYIASGNADALLSPSKLWHDVVVFPMLSAGLLYLGVPAIKENFAGAGKLVVCGFTLWLALVLADSTFHRVDIKNLHPPYQNTWVGKI